MARLSPDSTVCDLIAEEKVGDRKNVKDASRILKAGHFVDLLHPSGEEQAVELFSSEIAGVLRG